jgi:hypothetical protein
MLIFTSGFLSRVKNSSAQITGLRKSTMGARHCSPKRA